MRECGILLPVFSLPSKYGIGCFSNEARQFIDFLVEAGQHYWQILPLVPPGSCESPYQTVSTFAGNPMFIDLEQLVHQRLLTQEELNSFNWDQSDKIYYEKVKKFKGNLLKLAFSRSKHFMDPWYIKFCQENKYWLKDYSWYMAFKNNISPEYYKFEQFLFDTQWASIKEYANHKGIKIIGDLPIYVSMDSSDVYYNKDLFELEDGKLSSVAGCPPDDFSADGQVWGNPLYDWDKHKETGYDWWIQRIKRCFKLHDVVRIDHFRGFYDYFSIPAKDGHAKNGEWKLGPAMDFFDKIKEELGDLDFVAEDLGYLSPGVHDLLEETGFPGMKILQFAFNGGKDNPYLPENIGKNYIVYTGTHDNNTTLGWYNNASEKEKEQLKQYIPEVTDISWDLTELAMSTKAKICIIQMQDYLSLDEDARTNTPGTINKNWMWRMKEIPSYELACEIKQLAKDNNR